MSHPRGNDMTTEDPEANSRLSESPTLPTPTENTDIDEIFTEHALQSHYGKQSTHKAKAAIEQKLELERQRTLKWFIGTLKHNSYEDTIKLANIQLEALQASKEGK